MQTVKSSLMQDIGTMGRVETCCQDWPSVVGRGGYVQSRDPVGGAGTIRLWSGQNLSQNRRDTSVYKLIYMYEIVTSCSAV